MILNAYKPKGPTSHDVVDEVRKKFKEKKVGHAGTLDPFARGVLVIGVGRRGTRVLDFLKNLDKVYFVKMRLGIITETFDITGKVVEERRCDVSEEDVKRAIFKFVGEYDQVPPAYSAKKYKGRKLYELAREGKIIRLPPRKVRIYEIWDVEIDLPFVSFRARVSTGTYVRSLCMDIGYELDCGATAVELVREAVRKFKVEDSVNPFELDSDRLKDHLIDIETALDFMPGMVLSDGSLKKILNGGQPFTEDIVDTIGDFKKGDFIKLIYERKIVAIARAERSSSFIETLKRHGRNERVATLDRVLGV